MPRPLYIVCSQSGSEDSKTRLVSLFDVIEKITMAQVEIPVRQGDGGPDLRRPVVMPVQIRTTAVWMKNADDPQDAEYDFQLVLHTTHGETRVVHQGTFSFTPGTHLFRAVSIGLAVPAQPGYMRLESRIRRVGTEDWPLTQDYVIPVEQDAPEQVPIDGGANPEADPAV